jgi:acetate kinase
VIPEEHQILSVNCASSSIRFALYAVGSGERLLRSAHCEGIGLPQGSSRLTGPDGAVLREDRASIPDHETAVRRVLDWLAASGEFAPGGVGHRVVHGGPRHSRPVIVTPDVEAEIHKLRQLDPEHLIPELKVIRLMRSFFPEVLQVACFDTAFHSQMPLVAQMHPLPRSLHEQGIRRFGFHGLSYEYLLEQLEAVAGTGAAQGRVIIAHLGGGASMAAVKGGESIETTMGYMPNGGLMMGTRSGDLCPGVLVHLMLEKRLSAAEISEMVNFQSGLLGVSGVSRDIQELLKISDTNPHAAEAVQLYCYTAKKHLGSLAAALGGLDTLIFSGGVGENAPKVRWMICEQLEFLGIRIDQARNRLNAPVISPDGSPVAVRVMATNEEVVIARTAGRVLRGGSEAPRTGFDS